MKKILIVGAGISGSTVARLLADTNKFFITVIDKRNHIAGNIFDETYEDTNIKYHKYGPHLFHTNNKKVFDFLSKFTNWIGYKHKVKAQLHNGEYVTLPVNKETAVKVGKENILDIFYRPYTLKMWGKTIEEIDPEILNRVKVREDNNEFYFPNDEYQCIPEKGYSELIYNMLNHPNIEVKLNTKFSKIMEKNYYKIFNSMSIDEYYDFCFGTLDYRSIKFNHVVLPMQKVLPTVTVNFTNDSPYTRITEWKNIPNHGSDNLTVLTYEEPCSFEENNYERFYPVKDIDKNNEKLYNRYLEIENKKNIFIGRCGLYQYLDMDKAIEIALSKTMELL